jgi:hypothetical protein
MEILRKIQKDLKAPKEQYNKFGKFHYRSCEDILEAVKPLLGTATLTMNDEVVQIGTRYYVRTTVTLQQGGEKFTATAMAREPELKKGMDESQITGTASSYARKYALNGLFCIDDNKDADNENQEEVKRDPPNEQEQAVIDAIAEKIEAPKGKTVDANRLAALFFVYFKKYPDSMDGVDKTVEWVKKKNPQEIYVDFEEKYELGDE